MKKENYLSLSTLEEHFNKTLMRYNLNSNQVIIEFTESGFKHYLTPRKSAYMESDLLTNYIIICDMIKSFKAQHPRARKCVLTIYKFH